MIGHRTQPYRQGARPPGMALDAMLRGRAMGQMSNGADFQRAVRQMGAQGGQGGADRQRALQELILHTLRQRRPVATADVRGTFGAAGGLSPLAVQIRRQPITFEPRPY